jgi:hypothetical protein
MHCICLSADGGSKTWSVYQSCEILAYHHNLKQVDILVFILAESLKDDNCLHMLHPGNTTCKTVSSWPLPSHIDEASTKKQNVLTHMYGELFVPCGVSLKLARDLIVDNGRIISNGTLVNTWPRKHNIKESFCTTEYPIDINSSDKQNGYIPFTRWLIGPFDLKSLYLLTFRLRFCGETYLRLITSDGFSVDGPIRLLHRIKTGLFNMNAEDKEKWTQHLSVFLDADKHILPESFDVVILEGDKADNVSVLHDFFPNGIYLHQEQNLHGAQRYITTKQSFSLPLCLNTLSEVDIHEHRLAG